MENRLILLNYTISKDRKYYGGKTRDLKSINKKSDNIHIRETVIEIDSHTGTHIDYPAHFVENGRFGNDYPADYLVSSKCFLAEINLLENDAPEISASDIDDFNIDEGIEILVIKTGFCNIRDNDRYWEVSPVVSPELPLYLKRKFKKLKAVGFDIVSVSSKQNKMAGKECHFNFLSEKDGAPVLIIEDMDLTECTQEKGIRSVNVYPLYFEKMDGSPCTVLAELG
jgi:kynurenine formamidase